MRRLLWVDCIGAAVAGVTVIAFSGWLSRLEGIPQAVLLFTGAVNLLYGAFSFSLAVRAERPLVLIRLLAAANLTWALVCLGLLVGFVQSATPIAFVHFVGEAVYVGGLGVLEWRNRDLLRHPARQPHSPRRPPDP
jgi:hypothetical protein